MRSPNRSNPTVQMVTHPQQAVDPIDPELVKQREQTALSEIVACLMKYQARYHGAEHADKLWKRADKALKAWANSHNAETEAADEGVVLPIKLVTECFLWIRGHAGVAGITAGRTADRLILELGDALEPHKTKAESSPA